MQIRGFKVFFPSLTKGRCPASAGQKGPYTGKANYNRKRFLQTDPSPALKRGYLPLVRGKKNAQKKARCIT